MARLFCLLALLVLFAPAAAAAMPGSAPARLAAAVPDADNDGVDDPDDNCPSVSNTDQRDTDADGAGNACDSDDDNDGVDDGSDNCREAANPDQADSDVAVEGSQGGGDACDSDDDNDQVPDTGDNCRTVPNPSQTDADADGLGDRCDPDADGDGVANASDDCELVHDPGQANHDNDVHGDACDDDDDNDSIRDADEPARGTNPLKADTDDDGHADPTDACPTAAGHRTIGDGCPGPPPPASQEVQVVTSAPVLVYPATVTRPARADAKGTFIAPIAPLTCIRGAGACAASVTGFLTVPGSKQAATSAAKRIKLAPQAIPIAEGASARVRPRLSAKARSALRKAKRVKVTLTIVLANGSGVSKPAVVSFTLKAPRTG